MYTIQSTYSHGLIFAVIVHVVLVVNITIVELRSNGPASYGIPPIKDTDSWLPQPVFFFHFFCWLIWKKVEDEVPSVFLSPAEKNGFPFNL